MRNLKRLLSLGLALCLTLSLMCMGVVGASAASDTYTYGVTEFTDSADITQTDAVNMLVALNIIQGTDQGAFEPDRVVTRAEMAKMIYVLYNGGVDDGGNAWMSMSTPLTDINGHWAEGYIKGCYGAGIIHGVSGTEFAPDTPVTTLAVYKMLLTLVGYDAERAGLVGAGWDVNTSRLATVTGLTEDVTCDINSGMPRQFAAQAIYNGIDSLRVKIEDGEYVEYDRDAYEATVGEKYLGLYTDTGVLVANEDFAVGDATSASSGYVKIALFDYDTDGDGTLYKTISVKTGMDTVSYELMGQQVKIHYKEDKNNSSRYVMYGIYAADGSIVEDFTRVKDYDVDDLTGDKKIEQNALVYINYEPYLDEDGEQLTIGQVAGDDADAKYKLLDTMGLRLVYNDDVLSKDSEYASFAFVTSTSLNKVLTLNEDDIIFDGSVVIDFEATGNRDAKWEMEYEDSFDLTDRDYIYDIADDVDEDDMVWVTYNIASDMLTVTRAEPVTGELTGKREENGEVKEVRIDGAKYDWRYISDWSNYVDDSDFTKPTSLKLDDEYDFYILNRYAVAAEKVSGSGAGNDDYAILLDAYDVGNELRLKLLRADGVTKTYTINEFLGENVDDIDTRNAIADLAEQLTEEVTFVAYEEVTGGANILGLNVNIDDEDYVLPFTPDPDDQLIEDEIVELEAKEDKGAFYKESTGVIYGKDDSQALADEATIFFGESIGNVIEWDAYTLDDMDEDVDWDDLGEDAEVFYILNDDDDICLLVVMSSNYAPSGTSNVIYGYLTGNPYETKIDGTKYTAFEIWTEDGKETYYLEGSSYNSTYVKQHSVVAFCMDGDEIDSIYSISRERQDNNPFDTNRDYKEFYNGEYAYGIGAVTNINGSRYKIAEYDFDKTLTATGGVTYVTTDDTIFLYIDSDAKAGRTSGSVKESTKGVLNCVFVANEDDEIEMILVDKANKFIDNFYGANADTKTAVAPVDPSTDATLEKVATPGTVLYSVTEDTVTLADDQQTAEAVKEALKTTDANAKVDVVDEAGDSVADNTTVTAEHKIVVTAEDMETTEEYKVAIYEAPVEYEAFLWVGSTSGNVQVALMRLTDEGDKKAGSWLTWRELMDLGLSPEDFTMKINGKSYTADSISNYLIATSENCGNETLQENNAGFIKVAFGSGVFKDGQIYNTTDTEESVSNISFEFKIVNESVSIENYLVTVNTGSAD